MALGAIGVESHSAQDDGGCARLMRFPTHRANTAAVNPPMESASKGTSYGIRTDP